eukprot:4094336-Heterocapsa_arctica.AAC.1
METITCLVCKDAGAKNLFETSARGRAHLSYKRISLKTDQEPALVSLANAVISQREEETILEHSQ